MPYPVRCASVCGIHCIGFATADRIAQSVGIPKDSQNRARAGIDHVPLGATSVGHCALPLEKLRAAAVKLQDVPFETIEQAISQMMTSASFFLPSPEEGGGRDCEEDQTVGRNWGCLPEDRI